MTANQRAAIVFATSLMLMGGGCVSGVSRTERFSPPDIKDAFCGVRMDYRQCKCAFHGEFCKDIGKSKSEANAYVQAEYATWVAGLEEAFGQQCAAAGAAYSDGRCDYCETGYVAHEGDCVKAEDVPVQPKAEPVAQVDPELLDTYCSLDTDRFNADWKKYSDIDDRIPFEERSWEAQQAVAAYDDMITAMVAAFQIERDLEIERQVQVELAAYKDALVQNIKTNLLKSFWRLAWITYSTVDSARGVGESAATLLTEELGAESLGAGLKVIQANIPSDSALAIDTSSLTGQAKSVGASTALEAIDSLGDPLKIATEFVRGAAMATLPSADITAEEVEILKQQHEKNGLIDAAIQKSVSTIAAMEALLQETEEDIEQFQNEINEWEAKEKVRVAADLVDGCKRTKTNQ